MKLADMYEKLVALNDHWVKDGTDRQVLDSESRYYGGVADPESGIAWPSHGGSPMVMALWAAALANEDSKYFRDGELCRRLKLGAEFMLRAQHPDGTISPGWTNAHSPPDTGFVVVGLSQVYELLASQPWEPLQEIAAAIRLFLERSIPALLTGGCHTPNHRWVMTAALGFLFRLTGRSELRERAEQWLAEGLDCTEDGEWTERSNGIYNGISDIMLFHAAKLFDLPDLLDPVRRNLRMMAYLVHPDGEVVTDYSGRQDFGHSHDLSSYFLISKLMACEDRDPGFAAFAELAGQAVTHPGWLPNNALISYLLRPELRLHTVEATEWPDKYRVVLNRDFPRERYLAKMDNAGHGGRIYHSRLHPEFGAPVARQRDGRTSVTVMTEANSFFALRHGKVRLHAVQIASSFEPGYVKMNRLDMSDNGYRLTGVEHKGYYGPVPARSLPETANGTVSPWYLLPHHLREATHVQEHRVQAEIRDHADRWEIHVRCSEPENMMTQLTFVFGNEGELSGGERALIGNGAWFWKGGTVRYSAGDDWMELDGGGHEHFVNSVRNTEFARNCQTLAVNLMTPYDRCITIRLSK